MTKVIKNKTPSLLDKFSQTEEEFLKQHAPLEDVLSVLPPSIVTSNKLREVELENKLSLLAEEEQNISQIKQNLEIDLQAIEVKASELIESEKTINANKELLSSIENALLQKEQELAQKEDLLLTVAQQLLIKEEQLKKTKIPLPKIFERFSNHAQSRISIDQIFIENEFELSFHHLKRINLCLSIAVEFAAVNLNSKIEQVSIVFESPTRFSVNIDIKKTWSYILKVSPSGDFLLQKFNHAMKSWNVEYQLLSKEQSKNHIHGYQFNFNFDHAFSSKASQKNSKAKSPKAYHINKTSHYDV